MRRTQKKTLREKGTLPRRSMHTTKAFCLGPAMALSSVVWACILAVHRMGLIKTILKIPSYFKDWRFIHQQPFKSFKWSKSFYGPCRHVGLKGLLTVCSSQTGLAGPGFSGVWHYVDVPSIVCPGGPGRMDGGRRRMS